MLEYLKKKCIETARKHPTWVSWMYPPRVWGDNSVNDRDYLLRMSEFEFQMRLALCDYEHVLRLDSAIVALKEGDYITYTQRTYPNPKYLP